MAELKTWLVRHSRPNTIDQLGGMQVQHLKPQGKP